MIPCERQNIGQFLKSYGLKNYREDLILEKTVDSSVVSCIEDGILKDFLIAHRAEVIDMCLTEFDEKTFVNGIKEEGREEGRNERDKEKIAELLRDGRTPKEIADFCKYPMDLIEKVQESILMAK